MNANTLDRLRKSEEKRLYLADRNKVADNREEIKAEIHARELIGRYGPALTLEAAWSTFRDATEPAKLRHWKTIIDYAQSMLDKLGY